MRARTSADAASGNVFLQSFKYIMHRNLAETFLNLQLRDALFVVVASAQERHSDEVLRGPGGGRCVRTGVRNPPQPLAPAMGQHSE